MTPIPLTYYQAGGATSDCIQDAEREFLLAQGADPAHNQDMWMELLIALGYSGSLQDMLHEFWCVDGGVTVLSILGDDTLIGDETWIG